MQDNRRYNVVSVGCMSRESNHKSESRPEPSNIRNTGTYESFGSWWDKVHHSQPK